MIGIRYVSSAKNPSGYASAARNFIVSLFISGVNVTSESISQMAETTEYGLEGTICTMLEGRKIPYRINIIHLTPDLYPQYMEKNIYNIAHLFWECDRLPNEWIEPCNQMDEIWTASESMADMIHTSGVTTPCRIFPQPIYTQRAGEEIEPFRLSQPRDFIFYSIFQWIDRKNPRGLLRAYWKAFEGNDKVALLLKTYRVNYSKEEYDLIKRDIEQWKKEQPQTQYPKIYLVRNLLTDWQMVRLHKLGNCYVSASCGEGWNRPLQEAMLFGKPCISADNGGITDHITTAYYFFVPSSLQKVTEQSHIPWYQSSMYWKMLDEDALANKLKEVYGDYSSACEVGKKAQQYIVDNFSFQTVGERMKNHLLEISKIL